MNTHILAQFLLNMLSTPVDQRENPGDLDVWTKAIDIGNGQWVQVGLIVSEPAATETIDAISYC